MCSRVYPGCSPRERSLDLRQYKSVTTLGVQPGCRRDDKMLSIYKGVSDSQAARFSPHGVAGAISRILPLIRRGDRRATKRATAGRFADSPLRYRRCRRLSTAGRIRGDDIGEHAWATRGRSLGSYKSVISPIRPACFLGETQVYHKAKRPAGAALGHRRLYRGLYETHMSRLGSHRGTRGRARKGTRAYDGRTRDASLGTRLGARELEHGRTPGRVACSLMSPGAVQDPESLEILAWLDSRPFQAVFPCDTVQDSEFPSKPGLAWVSALLVHPAEPIEFKILNNPAGIRVMQGPCQRLRARLGAGWHGVCNGAGQVRRYTGRRSLTTWQVSSPNRRDKNRQA